MSDKLNKAIKRIDGVQARFAADQAVLQGALDALDAVVADANQEIARLQARRHDAVETAKAAANLRDNLDVIANGRILEA